MPSNSILVTAVTAALTLFGARAHCATLIRTTAYGEGADDYVWGGDPTANYGASEQLTTRNNAGNAANNYKTYLRFDLSGSMVELANATSATLEFTAAAARTGVGFSFFGLPDGLPGDAATGWSESGLDYQNAPGNVPGAADLGFLTTSPGDENGNYVLALGSLSGVTTSAGGVITFSGSSLLNFILQDTNGFVTIAIRRTDHQGVLHLASKENTADYAFPTLVIEGALNPSAPLPEPSALVFLAGGLGMLQILRRRHPLQHRRR